MAVDPALDREEQRQDDEHHETDGVASIAEVAHGQRHRLRRSDSGA
jgi:hypothetical protein